MLEVVAGIGPGRMTQAKRGPALFELHRAATGATGEAEEAAGAMLAALAARGAIDPVLDGLLIAHVRALARRLDNPTERAYGLAQVSHELRDMYADLAGRLERATDGPDPLAALALDG